MTFRVAEKPAAGNACTSSDGSSLEIIRKTNEIGKSVRHFPVIVLALFLTIFGTTINAQDVRYAGFRASRILGSYPNRQFPSPQYWSNTARSIASKFPNRAPAGIWIVSLYISSGTTQFNFPSNGISLPYVNFISTDQNESYLNHFDTTGISVWLQVEPGLANIDTLIHIVLNRYKHHPCVRGFGIDVEWYKSNSKIPDSLAKRWDEKVKSIDTTFTLFLKHYAQSWMPPLYRGSILFVDDSQDFTSSANPLNYMTSEFTSWGTKYFPNNVAFQFGYSVDSVWWKTYTDPMKTIGDALIARMPNIQALFWVDFTITKVFPITWVQTPTAISSIFALGQNFPNPFNPTTHIPFSLPARSYVSLSIYNLLGEKVVTLVSDEFSAGSYITQWNATAVASGVYFYRLSVVPTIQQDPAATGNGKGRAGSLSETRTLVLVR